MENNNTPQHTSFAHLANMWETHYMDLLKHSQALVTNSAQQILKIDQILNSRSRRHTDSEIILEQTRSGLLGEMRIHKDIIRHTHGFAGEAMIKELASGEHKTLVAQSI